MKQDEIIEMARQADLWIAGDVIEAIERFTKLVAAKEREACADICDEVDKESSSQWPKRLATMIRARGDNQ